jgi:alkylated DNA repair dioxygenase AlkB
VARVTSDPLVWQPSLPLAQEGLAVDEDFCSLDRIWLDENSWVDLAPGWVSGAEQLFDELVATVPWGQRSRWMYDRRVLEPRLTASWKADVDSDLPPLLDTARHALSGHYGLEFDAVGLNFYRDGRDSVAWHRDRIPKEIPDPVVALLSLGEPRRFRLRPYGGGRSWSCPQGGGDLLVTGGRTQRDWEHSVPKVTRAGPRISVAFRYGVNY